MKIQELEAFEEKKILIEEPIVNKLINLNEEINNQSNDLKPLNLFVGINESPELVNKNQIESENSVDFEFKLENKSNYQTIKIHQSNVVFSNNKTEGLDISDNPIKNLEQSKNELRSINYHNKSQKYLNEKNSKKLNYKMNESNPTKNELSLETRNINNKTIPNAKNQKAMNEIGNLECHDRLIKYKDIYSSKREELCKKYEVKSMFSFNPNISSKYTLSSQRSLRNDDFIPKSTRNKFARQNSQTYKPKICQKSNEIASKLIPSSERLLSKKKKSQPQEIEEKVPIINFKSKEIDEKNSKDFTNLNRFERLYLNSKEIVQKIDKTNKIKREQEILSSSECYFYPKINKNHCSPINKGTMLEREKEMKVLKEQKLKMIKDKNEVIRNEACTFKPELVNKINTKHSGKANLGLAGKSIQHYLNRIETARQIKEQTNKIWAKMPGSGNLWTRKRTQIKEFHFNLNDRKKCKKGE